MTAPNLQEHLMAVRRSGAGGVIPFISAGDPDLATTRDLLLALDQAGAAAIEVGVPFSDPIADGPVIQESSQRALASGTTLAGILELLSGLKGQLKAPLVLFSYLNPIDRMGFDAFATAAREAGVSGVLLTDVLPGEEPGLEDALHRNGLARIVLVAPTTPPARARALAAQASGFIYVIARRGVTGAGAAESEAPALVATLREVTDVPVYVGFGVSTRTDVETIHAYADGAIVGSALVLKLHQTPVNERAALAGAYLRGLLGEG